MKKSIQKQSLSKIVAKVMLRVFLILLALSAVPLLNKSGNSLNKINVYFPSSYAFIFPILLFILFVTLLVIMLKHKYTKVDINWLFSLNTAFLIAYLVLLYVRIIPQLAGM
ncbi:hypothetical protein J5U18_00215 [Sphingobacteriaceae bacterium WQ 2009]|uniref:Uncharacterized protein n=2 Tax=Rhinopithecimicrobium faecis TaxID=2820698 RepID=A0A8T4H9H4_9SPHI|nr:hypothetical protein [Sphingobacteriaceae bacterium WQ 2009]